MLMIFMLMIFMLMMMMMVMMMMMIHDGSTLFLENSTCSFLSVLKPPSPKDHCIPIVPFVAGGIAESHFAARQWLVKC